MPHAGTMGGVSPHHVLGCGGHKNTCVPPAPGCRELAWPPSQAWGWWKWACETLKLYRV